MLSTPRVSGRPLVLNDAVGAVRSIRVDPLALAEMLPALSVAVAVMVVVPTAVTLSRSVPIASPVTGDWTGHALEQVGVIVRMPDPPVSVAVMTTSTKAPLVQPAGLTVINGTSGAVRSMRTVAVLVASDELDVLLALSVAVAVMVLTPASVTWSFMVADPSAATVVCWTMLHSVGVQVGLISTTPDPPVSVAVMVTSTTAALVQPGGVVITGFVVIDTDGAVRSISVLTDVEVLPTLSVAVAVIVVSAVPVERTFNVAVPSAAVVSACATVQVRGPA